MKRTAGSAPMTASVAGDAPTAKPFSAWSYCLKTSAPSQAADNASAWTFASSLRTTMYWPGSAVAALPEPASVPLAKASPHPRTIAAKNSRMVFLLYSEESPGPPRREAPGFEPVPTRLGLGSEQSPTYATRLSTMLVHSRGCANNDLAANQDIPRRRSNLCTPRVQGA